MSAGTMAEQQYIADDLSIWIHTGPNNQYRIIGNVLAGESVDVKERNSETGYVRIIDSRGREGWIEGKHLTSTPSLRARLPELEGDVAELNKTLAARDSEIADLKARLAQLDEQTAAGRDQLETITQENRSLAQELAAKDESTQMAWFIRGAAVLGGGLLVGMIIPFLPRRRKQQRWM